MYKGYIVLFENAYSHIHLSRIASWAIVIW